MLAGRAPHQGRYEAPDSMAALLLRILRRRRASGRAARRAAVARRRPPLGPGRTTPRCGPRPRWALAQALQAVQRELGLEVTEPVVFDVARGGEAPGGRLAPVGPAAPSGGLAGGGWGDGMVPDLRPTFGTAPVAGDATVDAAAYPALGGLLTARCPGGRPGLRPSPFSPPARGPEVPGAGGRSGPRPAPAPRPAAPGSADRPGRPPSPSTPPPACRSGGPAAQPSTGRPPSMTPAGAGRASDTARQPRPAAVDVEGGARGGGRGPGDRAGGRGRGDGPARAAPTARPEPPDRGATTTSVPVDVPTDVLAVESQAGVQVDWAGEEPGDYTVLVLSEADAPTALPAPGSTSLLIPATTLRPDSGYCFSVAHVDAVNAAPEGGAGKAFGPPVFIRGASRTPSGSADGRHRRGRRRSAHDRRQFRLDARTGTGRTPARAARPKAGSSSTRATAT